MDESDKNVPPKKYGKIGNDSPGLKSSTDPRYAINHPQMIEGDEPKTPEEAEIRNLEDATKKEGISNN